MIPGDNGLLRSNRPDPILIVEVPLKRFADAGFEGVGGFPAELGLDFGGVDRVTAVVAGTILNKSDEFARVAAEVGAEFVDEATNELNDIDIGPFVVAANIVGLPCPAVLEDLPESFSVITDEEPIADIHAISINWQGFAGEEVLDYDGDELLGKLVWSVIVRAVGDDRIQTVGVVIRANQHIARGFA